MSSRSFRGGLEGGLFNGWAVSRMDCCCGVGSIRCGDGCWNDFGDGACLGLKSGMKMGISLRLPSYFCTFSYSLRLAFRSCSNSRFFSSKRRRCMANLPASLPSRKAKSSLGLVACCLCYSLRSLSKALISFSNVSYSLDSSSRLFITSTKSFLLASTTTSFSRCSRFISSS